MPPKPSLHCTPQLSLSLGPFDQTYLDSSLGIWPITTKPHPLSAEYQCKTKRIVPVFALARRWRLPKDADPFDGLG